MTDQHVPDAVPAPGGSEVAGTAPLDEPTHGHPLPGEDPQGEVPQGEVPQGEVPQGEVPRDADPRGEVPQDETPPDVRAGEAPPREPAEQQDGDVPPDVVSPESPESPVALDSVAEEPVTEEPVTEEPVAEEPVAEEPAAVPADAPQERVAADLFTPAGAGSERIDPDGPPPEALVDLARAYRIDTEFWDWQGRHVPVRAGTVIAVLAAMEVDAGTTGAVAQALAEAQALPWRRMLPPVVVVTEGAGGEFPVHVDHGSPVSVHVEFEDGGRLPLAQADVWVEPREVDGHVLGEARFTVPDDLPLGYHEIVAESGDERRRVPLVVTPDRLVLPPTLRVRRGWGYMTQLYTVRSRQSWGLGDLADLADLASWSGRAQGADFVLVNPLHAAEPVGRMEPSPYLPTTRRFVNPVYLRVEDIREVAYLAAADRAIVEWHAEAMRGMNASGGELDRDAVWSAKKAALEVVFAAPRTPARQAAFQQFCETEGDGLLDFATWCALAERYGLPHHGWPEHARDPRSEAVDQLREELADRIEFYMWLQWCLDEQLATAQRAACEAGMGIGIVHDLAVGVHPDGAESWALRGVLAGNVSVGAPPDAFNQQGQDWSQPPWRPDRLAELGYAPLRDMIRTLLRHAGGLRVDHIIGLFRLWWVPRGASPQDGTYVRYDHEAMIGILALEAHRAGAFVVGEDLGTVEPWVRDYLRDRGILGTSILWFEKDGSGRPLPPQAWRELCLATVTTHDLPPTAGYLAGEHIEVRDRLGLLTRSVEEETRVDEADRASVMEQLGQLDLLPPDPTERERVEGLHRFLTRTPSRLVGVALADAVGDRRAINQPGTYDEYPNWRLPLADGVAQPVLLEEIMTSPRARSLAQAVNGSL